MPGTKAKLELIIFDMDGLLIDSERVAAAAQLEAARRLSLAFDIDDYRRLIGVNHERGIQLLSEYWDPPTVDRFLALSKKLEREIVRTKGIPVKSGVCELFDYLDSLGMRRVVATSTARPRAMKRLAELGLLERVHGLHCGNEVEHAKPHPEIFLRSLGSVPAERALVFEDSYNGVRAATAAGIPVVFVPDLLPPDESLPVEAVLPDLHAAIPYLQTRENELRDR